MDKDDYFNIIDQPCCFPFDILIENPTLREELSLTTQNTMKNAIEYDVRDCEENLKESQGQNKDKPDINLKNYLSLIDDKTYKEEILAKDKEKYLKLINDFAVKLNKRNSSYFQRKSNLMQNILNTATTYRSKTNQLCFLRNPQLEEFSLPQFYLMSSLPGLKPLNSWEFSLDDLLSRLKSLKLPEFFSQPQNHDQKMSFFTDGLKAIADFATKNKTEALKKAVTAFLTVLFLMGDYLLLVKAVEFLVNEVGNKEALDEIFGGKDNIISSDKEKNAANLKKENQLISRMREVFSMIKENYFSPLPIMRNYSLIDYFNLSKAILFSVTDASFAKSVSSCTDGKYLYLGISGIDSCWLKVGTGFNGTQKGKIYLKKKNLSEQIDNNLSNQSQWVYCQGKIYQKVNKTNVVEGENDVKDLGYLNIISPSTLEIESKIRLLFPKESQNQIISPQNENYVLLSDGKTLQVLLLELSKKEENEEKTGKILQNLSKNSLKNEANSKGVFTSQKEFEEKIKEILLREEQEKAGEEAKSAEKTEEKEKKNEGKVGVKKPKRPSDKKKHIKKVNNLDYKFLNLQLISYDPSSLEYNTKKYQIIFLSKITK